MNPRPNPGIYVNRAAFYFRSEMPVNPLDAKIWINKRGRYPILCQLGSHLCRGGGTKAQIFGIIRVTSQFPASPSEGFTFLSAWAGGYNRAMVSGGRGMHSMRDCCRHEFRRTVRDPNAAMATRSRGGRISRDGL